MKTKTISVQGQEHPSAHEAIQDCDASGWDAAIMVGGKYVCVREAEAERLAAAGVEFAYLHDHAMPDGTHRIMTVPVN